MIIENKVYDGKILHQRFAYRYLGKNVCPSGDIIVFRGKMKVSESAMIDQEALVDKTSVYSSDAINFVWESPLLGQDPFGAVAYQRLFNTAIAEKLSLMINKQVVMQGDNIMVVENDTFLRASVSITHVLQNAALGHTGINISAGSRAPNDTYSTYFTDIEAVDFMHQIDQMFYRLNQDIFVATSKVR